MKKAIITLAIIGHSLLNAQNYTAEGIATKESKKAACSMALASAKSNALEEAGTLVFSNFNSSTSDKIGKLISGTLVGAEVVKKEYDEKTRSAHIALRIKKATIAKALEEKHYEN